MIRKLLTLFTGTPPPEQQVFVRDRYVTMYKLAEECKHPCRYTQKCGHSAKFEVKEIDGKRWYWCGSCQPGRKL